MLTSIQSAGVAPEVNLRNSWHTGDKACKQGIHPGFETQGRRHQKSKTGVSVDPRKGLMSSKNLLKKRKKQHLRKITIKMLKESIICIFLLLARLCVLHQIHTQFPILKE